MMFFSWMKQVYNKYRWLVMNLIGIIFMCVGVLLIYKNQSPAFVVLSIISILLAGFFIYVSVQFITVDLINGLMGSNNVSSFGKDRLNYLINEKKISVKGPKIVVIGGGTGLSTMLRGLKLHSPNITAIVTVADDGGGSGVLRQDLGILPPGDIRNCILALADTEPIMEKLLQYRFPDGMLKGQSFGNLFLAAMDGISTSFEEAVRRMSDVLAVTGRVLPVTLQDVQLCAELEDGFIICGESRIGNHNDFHKGKIKRVYMEPAAIEPLKEAIDAINEADIIVLGPGSLYTSIIPNLIVDGISEAIKASRAAKIYVCNVMTQPGETEGYTVADHIKAIEKHSCKDIIDYCIINRADIPENLRKKYIEDGANTVSFDVDEIEKLSIKIIEGDFVTISNNYIRHDTTKLAQAIMDVAFEKIFTRNKKSKISYYYVRERLKNLVG